MRLAPVIVMSDYGRTQTGKKRRHGAVPTTAMTHIAIQEHLEGKVADWMEQVSDEQYKAR